jgi:hypothetical protein
MNELSLSSVEKKTLLCILHVQLGKLMKNKYCLTTNLDCARIDMLETSRMDIKHLFAVRLTSRVRTVVGTMCMRYLSSVASCMNKSYKITQIVSVTGFWNSNSILKRSGVA